MGILHIWVIIKLEMAPVQTQREEYKCVNVVDSGDNLVSKGFAMQA